MLFYLIAGLMIVILAAIIFYLKGISKNPE